MGNIVGSGRGESLEVGKNCEKISTFTSNIVLTPKTFFTDKIEYNNSKFGKACLAGTLDIYGIILAQNKNFNFQWEILLNEDNEEVLIIGTHTKKCEKNSLAIFEVMEVEPTVLAANKEKISAVARKFKSNSELGAQIKKLCK
jgi:hypothetical protein